MSESHQKRRHPRVSARIPVRISTIDPERDPWTERRFFRMLQEKSANVSRGGAFVRTAELMEPGRRVLVELSLPDGRELETIGRVAWTKRILSPDGLPDDVGVGVEFLGGATEEFAALDRFLEGAEPEEEGGD